MAQCPPPYAGGYLHLS